MLLKCQLNENTNQNGVLFPTKCVERVLNNSCLVSTILDKLVSELLHKTIFICKTHNSALKIRNHHFMQKLTDLFKIIETQHELFYTISTYFRKKNSILISILLNQHFNSISSYQQYREDAPTVVMYLLQIRKYYMNKVHGVEQHRIIILLHKYRLLEKIYDTRNSQAHSIHKNLISARPL